MKRNFCFVEQSKNFSSRLMPLRFVLINKTREARKEATGKERRKCPAFLLKGCLSVFRAVVNLTCPQFLVQS